ncbi:MAG: ATP-binding cassette domain-containing protein, partial [Flavobacteriales bacterium]|nr:ATP-binding cassette domain-containing protein [Flavobacteriales bacterium]
MIALKGIKKSYGTTQVLRGIDATIAAGDFVSIVGPSGAGKSTLLHLIAGLDAATEGTIHFEGQAIQDLDKAA